MAPPLRPLQERFEEKFRRGNADECWLWLAGFSREGGYGSIGRGGKGGRHLGSHRLSFELYNCPIPDGMCVLHRCDTPACVNPSHLFLGTHADNVADRDAKGRHVAMRGEDSSCAKLTTENVLEIRRSPERGVDLARRFGVSKQSICDIRHKRKWNHVEEAAQNG